MSLCARCRRLSLLRYHDFCPAIASVSSRPELLVSGLARRAAIDLINDSDNTEAKIVAVVQEAKQDLQELVETTAGEIYSPMEAAALNAANSARAASNSATKSTSEASDSTRTRSSWSAVCGKD